MADDKVRQSDIDELKRKLGDLSNKLDEVQKDVSRILPPLAEMAIQVSHNERNITRAEDAMKDDLVPIVENQKKWDSRMWAIVGVIIVQLIALILAYAKGDFQVFNPDQICNRVAKIEKSFSDMKTSFFEDDLYQKFVNAGIIILTDDEGDYDE